LVGKTDKSRAKRVGLLLRQSNLGGSKTMKSPPLGQTKEREMWDEGRESSHEQNPAESVKDATTLDASGNGA